MKNVTTPDVSVLEDLDFQQPCIIQLMILGVPVKACRNPAVWVGYLPCCGTSGLLCQDHYNNRKRRRFRCGTCKKNHDDLIGWQRI